jgi:hypothetical protein
MNEHHILMVIRTEDTFVNTVARAVVGARGQIEGQIEATGVDPTKEKAKLAAVKQVRNEAVMAHHDLKCLLLRILRHADIGHVWDIHEHCDAKYDRGPCTCGLAELEKAIEEATKQP